MSTLSVRFLSGEVRYDSLVLDALVEISGFGKAALFAVEYKETWQERAFQAALDRVKRASLPPKVHPMIVLPYLSDERVSLLEEQQISGLDYCGNGIVMAPELSWYIRATGRPNKFRAEEQALKNPYQGKSALVGRTLLSQPVFRKLEDLYEEIKQRGGTISLALVSRSVKRLKEDAIVRSHEGNKVWLLQPEKLLDTLVDTARLWKPRRLWQGKVEIPDEGILPHLFSAAAERGQRLVVTGLGSAPRNANLAMEKTVRVYVESGTSIEPLLAGLSPKLTSRFPDLEIYAAPDDAVFFDAEQQKTEQSTIRWASPLQTYLEMQNGDSRLQDSAKPLRDRLLNITKEQKLV